MCEERARALGGLGAGSRCRHPYRGTWLIRNTHPPRTTIGPQAKGLCRVLRGGGVLMSEAPLWSRVLILNPAP